MDISVQGLIDSIKTDGTLPDGMFTDADYTKFLNEAFYSDVLAFIMKHREDYYVTYTDFPYANTIAIPTDAIGSKLNDVVRMSSDGKTILQNLPRLTREEMTNKWITGFYIEGNSIKFYPEDSISDTIRVYYFKRPLYLEEPANIATVLSYDSGVATVDQVPSWVGTASGCTITSHDQPYVVSTSTITASSTVNLTISVLGLTVGDYICRSGHRAVADLPFEVREVLIQAAIVKALISIKDKDGVKLAAEAMNLAKSNSSTILTPRVENEVKKVVSCNGIWKRRTLRRF